ncbi:hypothetical protein AA0498_1826 [Acidomonas methanolica]|uniref:Uncharacterized protein n=1 Tax=Acidomonas methanolica NBRC 104435 TaxID=1231351 RepID=A0A023D6P8_ACIMT|nr:hypothetical protein EDC31_12737 [Acidomonas methanolica]GAJ29837.1 hypothetical protein Amme_083_012 [Acidomonas methanolica NBRC 104435]GBQ52895.1 hypothetical protein AA0498_1826 [Acidomonas methanolica]GEL00186.1 hypothetical protein AME01nite_26840 [Acidomonas methanolica NBRC 104435]
MSDARECRPPEGTPNQSWHWVEQCGKPTIWLWTGKLWVKNGSDTPAWPRSARPRLRYLGPVAHPPGDADSPTAAAQLAALHTAISTSSEYESDAHAFCHAQDVLANLHERGWRLVREEGRDG